MKNVFFLLLVITFLSSCEKPGLEKHLETVSRGVDSIQRADFDKSLAGHQPTPTPPLALYAENFGKPQMDDKEICTPIEYTIGYEYDEQFVSGSRATGQYEGELLDANSLVTGENRPIPCIKAPQVFSISLTTKEGTSPKFEVEEPTLANIREATNEKVYEIAPKSTPAEISFEVLKVRSEQEVNTHLGASASGFGLRVSGKYNFKSKTVKSRFLIRFVQKYYSVDMDNPLNPNKFFKILPDLNIFQGTSPVFVSSVIYGRMVYLMVESESESEEVEKALYASMKKFKVKASSELTKRETEIVEQSKISGIILGGPALEGVEAVKGLEGLNEYLGKGAEFSVQSPGVPISYVLKHLKDNSIAKLVFNSNFTVQQCVPKGDVLELAPIGNGTWDSCPEHTYGDNEFGGPGVRVSGQISVSIKNAREVWVTLNVLFNENIPDDLNHPKDTRAEVDDSYMVYELKDTQKYIASIVGNTVTTFQMTPNSSGNHYPNFTSDFIQTIVFQADGGGDDLPCVGYTNNSEGRAFFRLIFKSLKVNVFNR